MKIRFLGAAGTVTGSRFLVEAGRTRVLVDCGLFQGLKNLRQRNWRPFPVPPSSLDAVLLTHAHLDHSGYLPVLYREGFRGKVICTPATADLCRLLLPDSGHIQEEDARYAHRKGYSKHHPARPLYTRAEAEALGNRYAVVGFGGEVKVGELTARFQTSGHILGAAGITLDWKGGGRRRRVHFSGDLGRMDDPVMPEPLPAPEVDHLVMESTYGDRLHPREDATEVLGRIVNDTVAQGGIVLVPAFAVGRAQTLTLLLHRLKESGAIPADLPCYLNSPMAVHATEIYQKYPSNHRLSRGECEALSTAVTLVRSEDESRALTRRRAPSVIIAASGMLTGGRVLHHLRGLAPDKANTILLTGYQAPGTRGAALARGDTSLKVHGSWVEVAARVATLDLLSAHADQEGLLSWLERADGRPGGVSLVHGDPSAADALRLRAEGRAGVAVSVAEDGGVVEL